MFYPCRQSFLIIINSWLSSLMISGWIAADSSCILISWHIHLSEQKTIVSLKKKLYLNRKWTLKICIEKHMTSSLFPAVSLLFFFSVWYCFKTLKFVKRGCAKRSNIWSKTISWNKKIQLIKDFKNYMYNINCCLFMAWIMSRIREI